MRKDLLIEHLHAINDRFGQLRSDHLAALAQLLKLSPAEVFEVASFYHHFEVVREQADGSFPVPPALTVRVCDGIACEMAGAQDLLARLPALLGNEVRVVAAPCIGRCEQAPVVAVHQCPVPHATPAAVQAAVVARSTTHEPEPLYRSGGVPGRRWLPRSEPVPRRRA